MYTYCEMHIRYGSFEPQCTIDFKDGRMHNGTGGGGSRGSRLEDMGATAAGRIVPTTLAGTSR